MANIQNELNNIKNAVYGKDVRNSIHDGISAINEECKKTTDRQEKLEDTFYQFAINDTGSDLVSFGVNRFNYKKTNEGYCNIDGKITVNGGYVYTEYIPVEEGKHISCFRIDGSSDKCTLREIRFITFYDEVYNVVEGGYDNTDSSTASVLIPKGVKYVRVTLLKGFNDKNTALLVDNNQYNKNTYLEFKEYEKVLNDYVKLHEVQVKELNKPLDKYKEEEEVYKKWMFKNTSNKLNPNKLNVGFYNTDGQINNTNESSKYTDPIEVNSAKYVTLMRTSNSSTATIRALRFVVFLDKDKQFIQGIGYNQNLEESVEIPNNENIKYLVATIYGGMANKESMLLLTKEPFNSDSVVEYEEYKNILDSTITLDDAQIKEVTNPIYSAIDSINNSNGTTNLLNKVVFNFGDSIAYGTNSDKVSYAHLIANKYGMTLKSFAVGGATLGVVNENNIPSQVDNAIKQGVAPDYILIDGVTNDIADPYNVALGEISEKYSNEGLNKSTTCGGFEYCLYTLKTAYPKAKIIYIRVHNMNTRDRLKQLEYGNKCEDICSKWSVPVVNIYKNGQMNTNLDKHKLLFTEDTNSTGKGDGTHPNKLGYELFYVPEIEAKLKTI